jgi:heat shock protein HslJ
MPTSSPGAGDGLANTQWQMLSFGPLGAETPVQPGSTITLMFDGAGQVGGQSGCNSYGGGYQVQDGTLSFGQIAGTLMACADEQVMQQEEEYLLALQAAGRFEQTADSLTIWYDEGASQLNFVSSSATTVTPQPPPAGVQPDYMAERVEFEPGATSATHTGTLAAGGAKEYALAASADQTVHVQTVGHGAPVSFTVYGPNGMTWAGEPQASDVYIFTSELTAPETGDYLVILSVPADAAETTYDVTFTIGTSASLPMTPQPGPVERVAFEPGTNSAKSSGLLPTGPEVQQYLLSANAGQTMTVDATSDGTPLSMTIESPSGNQWIPEMQQTADGYTIGQQFTLPEPGYYLVTLAKADHTPSTNYTITFTVQ